jgi:hypothetical protein
MLVKLDIAICEDDMMYCRDILDALTKNFLGSDNLENVDMGDQMKDSKDNCVAFGSYFSHFS